MPNGFDPNNPQFSGMTQLPQLFQPGASNTMEIPQQFQPGPQQVLGLPHLFSAFAAGVLHGAGMGGQGTQGQGQQWPTQQDLQRFQSLPPEQPGRMPESTYQMNQRHRRRAD